MAAQPQPWIRFSWRLPGGVFAADVPQGYRAREGRPDDCDSIIRAALAAYATDPAWATILGGIERSLTKRIRATLDAAGVHYAVVEHAGEIVAVSAASIERHDGHNLITGLCVDPRHQRRGLSRVVLARCLAWLRDQGLETAQVYTDPASIAGRYAYRAFDPIVTEEPDYRAPEASA
ncbi:MAG: GNAT family N-acetyltransferase [Alphaproteobacteria bacterium]